MHSIALVLLAALVGQTESPSCSCAYCSQRDLPARSNSSQTTDSFVVRSQSRSIDAGELSTHAEAMRRRLGDVWLKDADKVWSPRCEVVVHADRKSYLRAIGPGGEGTLGSTLIRANGGKIVARRIDLLADRAERPFETLPHELVHVMFAERFPKAVPPRWAEEGAALLADTEAKRQAHRKDYAHALRTGSSFPVCELVRMSDYPAPNRCAVFYGQSLVLVDFLLRLGKPEDFTRFVDRSMEAGHDQALREVYGISSATQLEQLWRDRAVNTVLVAN